MSGGENSPPPWIYDRRVKTSWRSYVAGRVLWSFYCDFYDLKAKDALTWSFTADRVLDVRPEQLFRVSHLVSEANKIHTSFCVTDNETNANMSWTNMYCNSHTFKWDRAAKLFSRPLQWPFWICRKTGFDRQSVHVTWLLWGKCELTVELSPGLRRIHIVVNSRGCGSVSFCAIEPTSDGQNTCLRPWGGAPLSRSLPCFHLMPVCVYECTCVAWNSNVCLRLSSADLIVSNSGLWLITLK